MDTLSYATRRSTLALDPPPQGGHEREVAGGLGAWFRELAPVGPGGLRLLAHGGSALLCGLVLIGCGSEEPGTSDPTPAASSSGGEATGESESGDEESESGDDGESSSESTLYRGEVWADNWSSFYLGDELIMEDSVSITTERSFNLETFTFEATPPFLVNVVMKDYIENDSGLEYIGMPNQQMGDGGYILQVFDEQGALALVSSADWKCLTIHEAPLNKECEDSGDPLADCQSEISDEPDGWRDEGFDDSEWVSASVYSAADVDPKQGYEETTWESSAEFIWGGDLESHNTILCRVWVGQ